MYFVYIMFAAFSILALFGSTFILTYLVKTERSAPRFSDSLKGVANSNVSGITVSIIIPARNEGEVISKCIQSLLEQSHSNQEIIVVDDSSSDNTMDVVSPFAKKDSRIKIVSAGLKPKAWVGKSWPCWKGYEHSSGAYLLFVDADSVLKHSAVELGLRYAVQKEIDMLSLSPRVEMRGLVARAVLPMISGAINLLYPMQKVNQKMNKRAYVFGTFVLVKRSTYEAIRGHERVKEELVEDAAIARVVKEEGYGLRVERGSQFITTLWESDSKSIYQGLERITSSSVKNYGLISILNAVLLFFITLYPILYAILYVLFRPTGDVAFVGFVAAILNILVFLSLSEFETSTVGGNIGPGATLYPVGSIFFMSAIVSASIKIVSSKELKWKGSGYIQMPNSKGR